MSDTVTLSITLDNPPPGVNFALQEGGGSSFRVVDIQRSSTQMLTFSCEVTVKTDKSGQPVLGGPFTSGPPDARFVYIRIGKLAGQWDSPWDRRLKVPLTGITADMISRARVEGFCLETSVPGTGRDGGPNCATVKPFPGWRVGKS